MIIVLCGIPGSGKTTLSKKIAEEQNAVRFSFDEMGCLQHKELIQPIIESLKSGKSVVVDALYAEKQRRTDLLSAVADIDCKKILVVMSTPLEECLRRNANREMRLPDFVVISIHQDYELPTLDEGWDKIITI
jgi:tRNA uridine 5-carbamoylmethylation protein Kti12